MRYDMTQCAIEERNLEFVTKLYDGSLRLPPGLPAGTQIKVIFTCDIDGCAGMQIRLPGDAGPSVSFATTPTLGTPPPLSDGHRP